MKKIESKYILILLLKIMLIAEVINFITNGILIKNIKSAVRVYIKKDGISAVLGREYELANEWKKSIDEDSNVLLFGNADWQMLNYYIFPVGLYGYPSYLREDDIPAEEKERETQ